MKNMTKIKNRQRMEIQRQKEFQKKFKQKVTLNKKEAVLHLKAAADRGLGRQS